MGDSENVGVLVKFWELYRDWEIQADEGSKDHAAKRNHILEMFTNGLRRLQPIPRVLPGSLLLLIMTVLFIPILSVVTFMAVFLQSRFNLRLLSPLPQRSEAS